MRILLLGGIGEALALARRLAQRHRVTYSLAGRTVRRPELDCETRVGGFGGVDGLAAYLAAEAVELLIGATHPCAARIAANAVIAARRAGVPVWVYRRPAWPADVGDDWREWREWVDLREQVAPFRRPFFTIGLEPFSHLAEIPAAQHWLVRCLEHAPAAERLTVLTAVGPFPLAAERELLRTHAVDVLIAKNSGGTAVAAKLAAARQLRLPVLMQARPAVPSADREFAAIEPLAAALGC
jgi:precorrin-6A/cobalt-precorrin-6A reductase